MDEVGARQVPAAFDDWVAARGPALLRLAYVLTGNAADAEDVVQDALSRGRDDGRPRGHRPITRLAWDLRAP